MSVCSVISYLKVSSIDYLVASDECVHLQHDIKVKRTALEVSLETPKVNGTQEKKVSVELHFK